MNRYKKIVITGGPCAGKTTALAHLRTFYESQGYTVIIVPETATELLVGGVAIDSMPTRLFQKALLELQLHKEQCFLAAANQMEHQKKIVFFDRGAMDGKAYMQEDEFAQNLKELALQEQDLYARYDAVLCMETAANTKTAYQTENNFARFESEEGARAVDARLQAVWQSHKAYRFIPANENFEQKIQLLTDTVNQILNSRCGN